MAASENHRNIYTIKGTDHDLVLTCSAVYCRACIAGSLVIGDSATKSNSSANILSHPLNASSYKEMAFTSITRETSAVNRERITNNLSHRYFSSNRLSQTY